MRGLLAVVLAALAAVAAADPAPEPRIEVSAHTTHLELGEPLHLQLRAEGGAHDMYLMDVSGLERDFRVEWLESARYRRERGGRAWLIQEALLRLYPRRAGTLSIPALQLGRVRSEPLAVEVSPARSLDLAIRSGVDNPQPYVREPVLVWLEVEAPHGDFETRVTPLQIPGAHVAALGRERTRGAQGRYVERHQWLVTPLEAGAVAVELPWVETRSYRRYGARLQLPVEPRALRVRAAPGYLPVQVPLAPVGVSQSVSAGPWWRGEPYLWSLELRGRDLATDHVQRLLAPLLERGGALRWYTPRISRLEPPDARPGETVLRVEIPFAAEQAGELSLPGLRVPWFDVRAGRLAEARVPPLALQVQDPRVHALRRAGLVLLVAALAGVLGALAWRELQALRARRRLLRGLDAARDVHDLRTALLAEGGARTLGEWRRAQPANPALDSAVQALERSCYGASGGPVARLRMRLRDALRAQPLRRAPWPWRGRLPRPQRGRRQSSRPAASPSISVK